MSDMKTATQKSSARLPPGTFTVRDMNRRPATLLKACDERGSITIRARNGRTYLMEKEVKTSPAKVEAFIREHREYRERLHAMGARPPSTAAAQARLDRAIAGE